MSHDPGTRAASASVSPLWLAWGALHGGIAVIIGAMASHATGADLNPEMLRLAADYQLSHALATIALAAALPRLTDRPARIGVRLGLWSMAVGLILFCGSLIGLGFGYPLPRPLGILTPIGGSCLILGWIAVALGGLVSGVRRG